jgi:hypothetical protein
MDALTQADAGFLMGLAGLLVGFGVMWVILNTLKL